MRRAVQYWGLTMLLYLLCLGVLWGEVLAGAARAQDAVKVTVLAGVGQALFYVMIRFSRQLELTPAWLSEYQGRFAVVCGVAGYAAMGPFRGATLVFFLVILVFCAFTLPPAKSRSLATFAVFLLGGTMGWLVLSDSQAFDPITEFKHFVLVGSAVLVVGHLTGRLSELRVALKEQKAELSEALARIQELAGRDELTALPNRRRMVELLDAESSGAGASSRNCIALIDIDHFKRINDTWGHATGDEVLREFARQSRLVLRAPDTLARWGGEEFLLHLPSTSLQEAQAVVERLRQQLGRVRFGPAELAFAVTFSAGLVEIAAHETMDAAVSRADHLMYAAKAAGRDRVVTVAPREMEI